MEEDSVTHDTEKMEVLPWDDPEVYYRRNVQDFLDAHRREPMEVAGSESPDVNCGAYEKHIEGFNSIDWNPVDQVLLLTPAFTKARTCLYQSTGRL